MFHQENRTTQQEQKYSLLLITQRSLRTSNMEMRIQRKPASNNPKIKNLLASNFVIYTPYKQEPI